MCVCVCVWERERERERDVYALVYLMHLSAIAGYQTTVFAAFKQHQCTRHTGGF